MIDANLLLICSRFAVDLITKFCPKLSSFFSLWMLRVCVSLGKSVTFLSSFG